MTRSLSCGSTFPAKCRSRESEDLGIFRSKASKPMAGMVIKAFRTSTKLQYFAKGLDVVDAHATTAAYDLHTSA